MNIKTGDIANCYARDTFLSKAISKLTNSEFSHTAIFLWLNGDLMVADAQKDGFQLRTYETWKKDFKYKYLLTRKQPVRTNHVEREIKKYVGTTPYDFYSLLVRQPRKLFLLWLNKTFKTNYKVWNNKGKKEANRMYCSEVVAKIIGVPNYYEMTPEDVLIWQLDNGYNIINE